MKTSSQIISNEDLEQKGQISKTSPLEKWIFCQQNQAKKFRVYPIDEQITELLTKIHHMQVD
ncbi:hypothetical protein [Sellimonas catena]|uniref:Uncharacterized protein n=1 Tax=Sellimonas catena TaxID=2994035 RepID=A0A9W6FGE1_9FIRM|nr:hypothetical protein [Sellimonas catena]GLG91264.1 hypothetical protein Selli2_26910 [Sellimonas catena]